MTIQLRGFKSDDLEAMHALDVACFEQPFRFSRTAMREFAESRKARIVIAEDDITEEQGKMVGFCILHMERVRRQKVGYVVTLDVAPDQRRSGLGRILMESMEKVVVAEGGSAMALHVYVGNAVAIAFYARYGFVFSHVAEGFYGDGMDAQVWHKVF